MMSEWWTYGPSDFLMFSARTYYRMLELHNLAWWPLQPFLLLSGFGLLWSTHSGVRRAAQMALILVGLGWLFVAWAFHWMRYAEINWGARYFGVAFAAQGLLLICLALVSRNLRLMRSDAAARVGVGLLIIAVLGYPMLALVSGRPLVQSECFGLAPDPTALATLGMVLCLRGFHRRKHPRATGLLLMLVPLLWCAMTGATRWTLGSPDWFLMPAAGIVALIFGWRQSRLSREDGR